MKQLQYFRFDSKDVWGFPDALLGNHVNVSWKGGGDTFEVLFISKDGDVYVRSITNGNNRVYGMSSCSIPYDADIAYKYAVIPPTIEQLWRGGMLSIKQLENFLATSGVSKDSIVLLIPKMIYNQHTSMYIPFPDGTGPLAEDLAAKIAIYHKQSSGIIPKELKRF